MELTPSAHQPPYISLYSLAFCSSKLDSLGALTRGERAVRGDHNFLLASCFLLIIPKISFEF